MLLIVIYRKAYKLYENLILDLDKFGIDKVISISSMPQWNLEAHERGVKRIVHKTYDDLQAFGDKVISEIKKMLKINIK